MSIIITYIRLIDVVVCTPPYHVHDPWPTSGSVQSMRSANPEDFGLVISSKHVQDINVTNTAGYT